MMAIAIVAASAAPGAVAQANSKAIFHVADFGAIGDGKTLDTAAINRAITAAATAGGGVLIFPAGDFLTGSIRLQSNVTLHLDSKCVITAAPLTDANYDPPEFNATSGRYQDDGHSHWHNSLIWGDTVHDVAIEGPGQIEGSNLSFHHKRQQKLGADKSLALVNCQHVRLQDFTIVRGGHFAILATGVSDLQIGGLTIDTDRDGIDVDSCQRVTIARCAVNAPNDDGICLKSSWALGKALATQDVTIVGCALSGFDCGTLLDGTRQRRIVYPKRDCPVGRIKLGTESAGGFSDINISDCSFTHTRGLAIESVDGGLLEQVRVERLAMQDVIDSPLFIRLGSRLRRPDATGKVSRLRDITISDLTATDVDERFPAIVAGTGDRHVENVKLQRVRLSFKGGGLMRTSTTQPAMIDARYPEPELFPNVPAYGLLAQNVDGLQLDGVELSYLTLDRRSPAVFQNVTGAVLKNVNAMHADGVEPFVGLPREP